MATVLVTNQTLKPIVFPRTGDGVIFPTLTIDGSETLMLDAEEWAARQKCKAVKHYVDRSLLSAVMRPTPAPTVTAAAAPAPRKAASAELAAAAAELKAADDTLKADV
jgi:hypothetical protein